MDGSEFIRKLLDKSREYITMNNVEVVDEKGNPVKDIIFDIEKNNRIIIKIGAEK